MCFVFYNPVNTAKYIAHLDYFYSKYFIHSLNKKHLMPDIKLTLAIIIKNEGKNHVINHLVADRIEGVSRVRQLIL
jgi:hypothetical protein